MCVLVDVEEHAVLGGCGDNEGMDLTNRVVGRDKGEALCEEGEDNTGLDEGKVLS